MLKLNKTNGCIRRCISLVYTSSLFSSLGLCSLQLVSVVLYKRDKLEAIVLKVIFENGSFELYEF